MNTSKIVLAGVLAASAANLVWTWREYAKLLYDADPYDNLDRTDGQVTPDPWERLVWLEKFSDRDPMIDPEDVDFGCGCP